MQIISFIAVTLFATLWCLTTYAASFDCAKATTETEISVCFDLGYQAFEKEDFQAAFDSWKPLADAGDAHAQYNIAQLYYGNEQSALFGGWEFFTGYGINRNVDRDVALKEALKWYKLAAEQGIADAQYNLGIIYTLQFNDKIEGIKWTKLAAENGNVNAQWNLANYYFVKGRQSLGVLKKFFYESSAYWFGLVANVEIGMTEEMTEDDVKKLAVQLSDAAGGDAEFSDSMQIAGQWSMKKFPEEMN